MPDKLIEFLKKKKEETQKGGWEKIKKEWLATINEFYKQIKQWLSEPLKEGYLTIDTNISRSIDEDGLGHYIVKVLRIKVNNDIVTLIPVGRRVVGAKGAIDMKSKKGNIRFVLTDDGWIYSPGNRYEQEKPLTEELFKELFMQLLK